jgi:hypothetical protein
MVAGSVQQQGAHQSKIGRIIDRRHKTGIVHRQHPVTVGAAVAEWAGRDELRCTAAAGSGRLPACLS